MIETARNASRPMPRPTSRARVGIIIIAAIALMGVLYMAQATETVIIGERVHDKQERLSRLTQLNAQLEADLAVLSAPDRLDARAKSLSLHIARPDQVKFLPVEIPVMPTPSARSDKERGSDGGGAFNPGAWWNDLAARFGWSRSSEPQNY